MEILDKGFVELKQVTQQIDFSVVAAARVSNGVSFDEASKGEEADAKLINYLIKHRHGTPFEHNLFTFHVKVPLFVRSEWHRHRIGWSYNEVSRRYIDTTPDFYIPSVWRVQGDTNKQGSKFLEIEDAAWQDMNNAILHTSIGHAIHRYERLLENGVAKEMARMVLPQNMYTEFYATCNARSLMNFLNLRTDETAQFEIRQYAEAMEYIFSQEAPLTYKAWYENGKVAP